jgi:hypothetical protein
MYVSMYLCSRDIYVHHSSYSVFTCMFLRMYVTCWYACVYVCINVCMYVCMHAGKQVISLLVRPNSSAKSLVNLESEERFYL